MTKWSNFSDTFNNWSNFSWFFLTKWSNSGDFFDQLVQLRWFFYYLVQLQWLFWLSGPIMVIFWLSGPILVISLLTGPIPAIFFYYEVRGSIPVIIFYLHFKASTLTITPPRQYINIGFFIYYMTYIKSILLSTASSAVDRGLEARSGQTKDNYYIVEIKSLSLST